MGDWLWTLQDVFGFLSGKVHSHHHHKEIEDEDLENTLIENYKDEDQPLDEFEDNNEDLQLEDMDGQLADPRAYPLPMLWRWLQRVSIGCTIKCARYNWCVAFAPEDIAHILAVVIVEDLYGKRSNKKC